MPISANEIWKFKAFIAVAISEATGRQVLRNNITIGTIKDVQQGFLFSGTYRAFLEEATKDYSATLTSDGLIVNLKIGEKEIIS